MVAGRGFPIQVYFVLGGVEMRIFLVALSLLYVLGVSFARNLDFGVATASSACISGDVSAGMVRESSRRVTYEILPNPNALFGKVQEPGPIPLKNELSLTLPGC